MELTLLYPISKFSSERKLNNKILLRFLCPFPTSLAFFLKFVCKRVPTVAELALFIVAYIYAFSLAGIALQLSNDPSSAETVYKRALSLSTAQQAHAILSNLGNLYRQQRRFEPARAIFSKSLELCPGYAPANNNLGLVFVAEGSWEEAKNCFEKALRSDPLLDAAKSNMVKAMAMLRVSGRGTA